MKTKKKRGPSALGRSAKPGERSAVRLAIAATGDYESTRVYVAPLAELPRMSTARSTSPRSCLVDFCERHGWHTAKLDPITDPIGPARGLIYAGDRKERVAVIVSPIAVLLEKIPGTYKGTRYAGMYQIALSHD